NPRLGATIAAVGGAQRLVDTFFSAVLALGGFPAAAYAVQAVLRLRAGEASLRAEPLLATRGGRARVAAGHLAFAFLGPALLLVAMGLVAGAAHGDGARLVGPALRHVPAAWIFGAIATALFGIAPRFTGASWPALIVLALVATLDPILRLPSWLLALDPFSPPEPTGARLVGLAAAAAALAGAGLVGLRRRDVSCYRRACSR